MPTTLTNGIQLPDKGSVDWYSSMQSNYNLIDTHLGDTDVHVTTEDKTRWDGKQGSLSQAQLDAIAQVATNTSDIATLQTDKANASHTHSSSDITDIGDYATKTYVDNSISGLVDSAPNALDTLNELAAALNDDANFATTVTNALANKANSADLATVATSGSYNDLSNKPTIPTVNDATLTIQKNGTTVNTFTANASSNVTANITVPTKTSDLTNDSNFVDTSNAAVASGITSTKVTSYDGHIADTDIHVTTADKTKWNNGVSQAYVLRHSSSSVTDNSTIAYSTLDNTDNIKSGDKVIDVNGKIFAVVSVDTVNSTVTVGSALIDLALDGNVVHTSGNETVAGKKELSEITTFAGSSLGSEGSANARTCMYSYCNRDTKDYSGVYQRRVRQNREQGSMSGSDISQYAFDVLENQVRTNNVIYFVARDFVNDIPQTVYLTSQCTNRTLGSSNYAWSNVFANQINGLEPSALGMPDLANGIDISSYITDLAGVNNEYTPTVNGWICVRSGDATKISILDSTTNIGNNSVSGTATNLTVMTPCIASRKVNINVVCTTLSFAVFIPCLGNI